ncbi:mitochondrial carrier [Lojkania enalia]|uniref:Mitochondrial carrier n=1 Tax=Lojkania enalia TaxID=147567 RepID=A0A9P4KHQ5_9PLEO|nr:mitochondrial carrier [Didymosphaeria enalia]
MSADFWSGYLSGAAGILIGNPLDVVKTRLQAGRGASGPGMTDTSSQGVKSHFDRAGTLVRGGLEPLHSYSLDCRRKADLNYHSVGATAPILGYGALNAILFITYNRSLELLGKNSSVPTGLLKVWCSGAAGGLATFVVSAPTELIKCRAQVSTSNATSWSIVNDIWRREGVRGLYYGGGITSVRDAVGYGFYFWSYEGSRQAWSSPDDTDKQTAIKVLLCGGLAGIVTWASIFPLDVIKTRVQTQVMHSSLREAGEQAALLQSQQHGQSSTVGTRLSTFKIAKQAYQTDGGMVFFRGLGICSLRAFVVNAVQWAVYEWMMRLLQ